MKFGFTHAATADELIKQLVGVRSLARRLLIATDKARAERARWAGVKERTPDAEQQALAIKCLGLLDERLLEMRFAVIEIGRFTLALASALDGKAPRAAVFDALNVGQAARRSPETAEYGQKTIHLIAVLKLENSSTEDDSKELRPLAWCCERAMMNAMTTNAAFDRAVHEIANEVMDGAFGEYHPRPLVEVARGAA